MAKKSYPSTKKLINIFIDSISNSNDFNIISSDTYIDLFFKNTELYVYIKCISHEGSPWPLECQRAQLPIKKKFDEIKNNEVPFIFLGYDQDNDVFVCWNPLNVKPRLNQKSSVSFHSRLSLQQGVKEGNIEQNFLTNGDKIVLFKRNDTICFFNNIGTYFDNVVIMGKDNNSVLKTTPKLLDLNEDLEVLNFISNSSTNSILELIKNCAEKYQKRYNDMGFNDWYSLVKNFLDGKEKADSNLDIEHNDSITDSLNYANVAEPLVSPFYSRNGLENDIDFYKTLLRNINTSIRNGKRAPHKYILLLAVLSMIEEGKLIDNKIMLNGVLISYFKKLWDKHVFYKNIFNENIQKPYWHMQNEPFWHLFRVDGQPIESMKANYSKSFLMCHTFAKLDDKLYKLIQDRDVRLNLIELITKLLEV